MNKIPDLRVNRIDTWPSEFYRRGFAKITTLNLGMVNELMLRELVSVQGWDQQYRTLNTEEVLDFPKGGIRVLRNDNGNLLCIYKHPTGEWWLLIGHEADMTEEELARAPYGRG